MTTSALWTKHRPLARSIASEFFLPGSEQQDVEQEAYIGLWIASRGWDPGKGKFPAFARVVIRRRLVTLLRAALAGRHAILTNTDRDDQLELESGPDLERVVVARETVRRIAAASCSLTTLERWALSNALNGVPIQSKADDNARFKARRKLRKAAA